MADPVTDAEVIASKFNVGLARSQRVIQSFLAQARQNAYADDESEDEDFKGINEHFGLGGQPKDGDGDGLELVKKSRVANDKLLEHIIGRKAAQAKRKSHAAADRATHVGSKPLTLSKQSGRTAAEESEDEEQGRTAAFPSTKRSRQLKTLQPPAVGGKRDFEDDRDVEPPDREEDSMGANDLALGSERISDGEEHVRAKKRKTGSYLDEVLSQKARKRKKKKNNAATS